jgi:hypothetical protein
MSTENEPVVSGGDAGDAFVAGLYLHLRRGSVSLPVAVWFGPPVDLENDEPVMDRSPRWQISIADKLLGDERVQDAPATVLEVWPRALASPIDQAEYDYRMDRIHHARAHNPNDPFGHPRGRIDFLTAELPF